VTQDGRRKKKKKEIGWVTEERVAGYSLLLLSLNIFLAGHNLERGSGSAELEVDHETSRIKTEEGTN